MTDSNRWELSHENKQKMPARLYKATVPTGNKWMPLQSLLYKKVKKIEKWQQNNWIIINGLASCSATHIRTPGTAYRYLFSNLFFVSYLSCITVFHLTVPWHFASAYSQVYINETSIIWLIYQSYLYIYSFTYKIYFSIHLSWYPSIGQSIQSIYSTNHTYVAIYFSILISIYQPIHLINLYHQSYLYFVWFIHLPLYLPTYHLIPICLSIQSSAVPVFNKHLTTSNISNLYHLSAVQLRNSLAFFTTEMGFRDMW